MANIVIKTVLVTFFMWTVNLSINTILYLATEQMTKEIQRGKCSLTIKWIQEKFKEWKDRRKQGKSEHAIADAPKTTKFADNAIKWPEMIVGLSTLSTIIFSVYSIFVLLATENYLEKYNIGYINAHLPSYSFILRNVIVVIVMEIIMLVLVPIYICISEWINHKNLFLWLISRLFIYFTISLVLVAYMFLSVTFLSSNYKISAIGIASIKSAWYYLTDPQIGNIILKISVLISIVATIIEIPYKLIEKKENWIPSFLVIAVALIGTTIVVPIEIQDEGDFATVHIQTTEDIKAWTKNTLIADDGKQVWAIVYETKTSYFVEPLIDTTDTNANKIKDKAEIVDRYEIDKNHYMMLDKVNTIVYGSETVKKLNQAEKK